MRVKVRNHDLWWLPRTGPVWRLDAERSAEGADGGQSGVEEYRVHDCQHSEMRAGVAASGRATNWLRAHMFLSFPSNCEPCCHVRLLAASAEPGWRPIGARGSYLRIRGILLKEGFAREPIGCARSSRRCGELCVSPNMSSQR